MGSYSCRFSTTLIGRDSRAQCQEVATFAAQFKPGHWCFLWLASEKAWWNGNPTELRGQWNSIALQMTDIFKCRGRLRAQTQGEQSPVRYRDAPKSKLISIGFSQQIWNHPAQAKHRRVCDIRDMSNYLMYVPRRLSAVRWSHVFDDLGRC